MSMQPRATSISDASPIRCPSIRGSPRAFAQRPLPSITSATWFGTSSRGMAGGRAPLGCGGGGWGTGPAYGGAHHRPDPRVAVSPVLARRSQKYRHEPPAGRTHGTRRST